jgi:hypothetical protein
MKIHLPRDYEIPPIIENSDYFYKKIFGLQEISLADVTPIGLTGSNFLTDVRKHFDTEIECLHQVLECEDNNSKFCFNYLYSIWTQLRNFKDIMALIPSDIEKEINSNINSLIGQNSTNRIKVFLAELLEKIKKDFRETINYFFFNKGYAYITFATRTQAERAILLASHLEIDDKTLQGYFDRNFPEYFYHDRLIQEAYTRESRKLNHYDELSGKTEITLNHHLDKFKTKVLTYMALKSEYLGSDDGGDPIINRTARTEEESKDIIAKIEGIDDYGGQKRESAIKKAYNYFPHHIFSSTDDYLEDDLDDNRLHSTRGRLYDKKFDYTKKLMKSYILNPDEVPVRKEDINSLVIFPEVEFPKELPPVKLWASTKDKLKAKQKIISYSEFFHEPIPEEIASNPSLLVKEQYGDFPNIRYRYELPYDYLKPPKDDLEVNKHKLYMKKLREKIRNITKKEEIQKFDGKVIEIGEEETYIYENSENIRITTDSDEEQYLLNSVKKANSEQEEEDEKEKGNKKKQKYLNKIFEIIEPELDANIETPHYTQFVYEGDDIEKYVEELNAVPYTKAWHGTNQYGEKIVQVALVVKNAIKLEDAQYIYDKYGKEFLSGVEEIEIDEEDKEKMEQFLNVKITPKELLRQLIAQDTEKKMNKNADKSMDLDIIKKFGLFANSYREALEREDHLNTIEI